MLFDAIKHAAATHHKLDFKPNFLMADAAFQIKNGFKHSFAHVVNDALSILMCWFHAKRAVAISNKQVFRSEENKGEIIDGLNALHFCSNVTVFQHALELFLSKWEEGEPEFCAYFKSEWIQKHPNWFAAANLKAPNTNNPVEGFNSSIKKNHTFRRRLPLTLFKETLMKMLRFKSGMYIREKERNIFYEKPKIDIKEWKTAALYATDPATKKKVLKYSESYYIVSQVFFYYLSKN